MHGAKKMTNGTLSEDGGQLVGPMLDLERGELDRLAELLRLLGDRTRLAILQRLSGGETNVGRLCELLQLPQPTVSHHLSLLRNSGLIDNRRAGKQVFYRLNGRISKALLPPNEEGLKATRGGKQLVDDGDPTGMQIAGRGFAIQLLNELKGVAVPDAYR